eukprot:TRINITY_DN15749_c0_g1_i1.p1 TRINITY_DN15749_c0_g1~~TRINITY_DN15749_c0_g1_i1.p1  ORF type:complete len:508 (-),score=81.45 TRINITY_DN15749_c0_g1_i1:106-1629(-)
MNQGLVYIPRLIPALYATAADIYQQGPLWYISYAQIEVNLTGYVITTRLLANGTIEGEWGPFQSSAADIYQLFPCTPSVTGDYTPLAYFGVPVSTEDGPGKQCWVDVASSCTNGESPCGVDSFSCCEAGSVCADHVCMSVLTYGPTLGPTTGGTNVTVMAFGPIDTMLCYFDGIAAAASFMGIDQLTSANIYTCLTPAHAQATYVSIGFGTPLVNATTGGLQPFQYYVEPAQHALTPALGPLSGGTVVTMTLVPALPTPYDHSLLACGFRILNTMQWLAATYDVDQQTLKCVTPAVLDSQGQNFSFISVTLNQQNYSPETRFYIYQDPVLLSSFPSVIPWDQPTNLTISGVGFFNNHHAIFRVAPLSFGALPAIYVNPNTVIVTFPPQRTLFYNFSIQLSMNGQNYGLSTLSLINDVPCTFTDCGSCIEAFSCSWCFSSTTGLCVNTTQADDVCHSGRYSKTQCTSGPQPLSLAAVVGLAIGGGVVGLGTLVVIVVVCQHRRRYSAL